MEKVWLNHYPKNMPAEVDTKEFASLRDVLRTSCDRFADLPDFPFEPNYAEIAAIPGDPEAGTLRVGDTLSERNDVRFTGLPNFAPEILRRNQRVVVPLEQVDEFHVADVTDVNLVLPAGPTVGPSGDRR